MKNKIDDSKKEQVTDVKETIIGFVAPDPEEKTQEQEIQDFKLKKQNEKELAEFSEEERKKKREEYEREEERLEIVKAELVKSISVRIPAIEKKFKFVDPPVKKGKVVDKVKSKTRQNIEEKEADLSKKQNQEEKERE